MNGQGTTFATTTDSGSTWILAGNIKEMSFPEESKEVTEDSYLDAIDSYKEFVGGMIDAGETNITLKWDVADTTQVALHANFASSANNLYQIKLPDLSTYTFDAVCSGRGKAVTKNETITQTFKFKLSGPITEVTV